MPTVSTSPDGRRLIVRNVGPAGPGVPDGGTTGQIPAKASNDDQDVVWVNPPDGTDAAVGPASATDSAIALFDGTTGKLIKDSGVLLAALATVSALSTKEDSVAGKGLSEEDFTTVLKNKLDSLVEHYRGTYASTALVISGVASPVAGDYALVEVLGSDLVLGLWDDTNSAWRFIGNEAIDEAAIALLLFDDGATWSQADCNIFTDAYKTLVDQHESVLATVADLDVTRPYGSLNFFDMAGATVTIPLVSDGLTNMVKVGPTTSFGALSLSFDDGGGVPGRLRYTGTESRLFTITADLSVGIPINDLAVVGLAKNGTVISSSRVLQKSSSGGDAHALTLTAQVQLELNEYVEVYIGNTTTGANALTHSLLLTAAPI